jgi:uncharacterized membrane protein
MKSFIDRTTEAMRTRVAIARHPVHPMLVPFPIALIICTLAGDVAFLYSGDAFWSEMSFWLIGTGTVMGILAGLAGSVELLAVRAIRRHGVAWDHFIMAMVLLSIAAANGSLRFIDRAEVIVPWGLYLSVLGAIWVGVAGWLGGQLVFHHRAGILLEEEEEEEEEQQQQD